FLLVLSLSCFTTLFTEVTSNSASANILLGV
ncbi:hypothetical protein KIPB_011702, partial [Kipferlia bialata]